MLHIRNFIIEILYENIVSIWIATSVVILFYDESVKLEMTVKW